MTPKSTEPKFYNLFVYGSLREPTIFESVCGLSFTLKPSHVTEPYMLFAELALLDGYRRVSPDNVYFYAVKKSDSKIQGIVIHHIPAAAMTVIDKYEGRLYTREAVMVHTANGPIEAQAYLNRRQDMKKHFGDRFHVNLIHELWLRKRIENFFDKHTRPGEMSHDADVERRARRELVGTTERDLVVSHLGHDAVSDFYLEHELDRPIPSLEGQFNNDALKPYITHYLSFVVKQVLLNQFEHNLQFRFRFELDRLVDSMRYYTRTVSLLIALRMLNANSAAVNMVVDRCLETMPATGKYDLLDYVKYAVSAADNMFDSRVVHNYLQIIRHNLQPGLIPMGAEMEFSNLGYRAVLKNISDKDPEFDGFRWFDKFVLDILTWKMGGYIDAHTGDFSPGQCGFFEVAPGRLNIAGEVSKPATADPWILSQLIREAVAFYPIRPHSLHLSFQLRRNQIGHQSVLPLNFVKCLFVLGGGTQISNTGQVFVTRMSQDEIRQDRYGEELVFARTSKRTPNLSGQDEADSEPLFQPVSTIQQYKFIRLDGRANYEPLIMALKGLQLSINPGNYLTPAQLASNPRLQEEYEELKDWAAKPTAVNQQTQGEFLGTIREGLMKEGHHKTYHKLHYIDWAVGAIEMQIHLFNEQVNKTGASHEK
jgi:gamma-glutamylcyclotransferase (GGCT)/AIG2-like uncharacterized protein YtfP